MSHTASTTDERSAANLIEALVEEYLTVHPDFEFPSAGCRDACTLALASPMQPWLMERLSGPMGYWTTMLSAAKHWFRPTMPLHLDSTKFNYFCYCIESVGNLGCSDDWYHNLIKDYREWLAETKMLGKQKSIELNLDGILSDLPDEERKSVTHLVAQRLAIDRMRDFIKRRKEMVSGNKNLPFMPFSAAVLRAAKGDATLSSDVLACRIANEMFDKVSAIVNEEMPPFFQKHRNDEAVIDAIDRYVEASELVGTFHRFRTWKEAREWIIHVDKVINPEFEFPDGFEAQLIRVFDHVWQMHAGIPVDMIAYQLGYDSVDEANNA